MHDVLLELRRQLGLHQEISIVRDIRERELKIWTDAGRSCRPLFIVKDQILKIKQKHIKKLTNEDENYGWNGLLKDGVVELIDTEEEETIMIEMDFRNLKKIRQETKYATKYTHTEIHPSMILGIAGSIINY
jgi:DNA-directed RNA polymerase II subunit RPB2